MIKTIRTGDWDFGVEPAGLVKRSSRGLRGCDLADFIKRADCGLAHKLASVEALPGEELVHLIALGATEGWGCNRNFDGFSVATCRACHDTFVKDARWYRNHNNTDPAQSYGVIKMSCYNEEMKRVELIVALNGTKEAALRNGGLIADRELQKLASGKPIAVSMSCKIAFDVCQGCGNKAKSRREYCTPDMCKYGGCRYNLGKVAADGRVLFVDNPAPLTWFDISDVERGADRTAHVLGHRKLLVPGADGFA